MRIWMQIEDQGRAGFFFVAMRQGERDKSEGRGSGKNEEIERCKYD